MNDSAWRRPAPTFVDPGLEQRLSDEGFVVIDLLDQPVLDSLRDICDAVYADEREGFHASNLSSDHDYRHSVSRLVQPVIGRAVDGLFVDHEPYTASLLMKWPDDGSEFHTHQDWTMVDEERFRTVNVWCPLVDADEENGCLRVLPGSHMVLDAIRCSPMPPEGCESPGWQVHWSEMDPVHVQAGQAVVFDHALLHASGPNRSGTLRQAVAAAFRPRQAQLQHWYLPDPRDPTLEVFTIDGAFFADIAIGDRPDYPVAGTQTFVGMTMTKDELLGLCGRPRNTDVADLDVSVAPDDAREPAASEEAGPCPSSNAVEPSVPMRSTEPRRPWWRRRRGPR